MLTFLLLGLIPWFITSGWVALSGLWIVSSFFIDVPGSKDPAADLGTAVILLDLYPIVVLVFAIIRNKISKSLKTGIFVAALVILAAALFFVGSFHVQTNELLQQRSAAGKEKYTPTFLDYVCTRKGDAIDFIRLNKVSTGESAGYVRVNSSGGFISGSLGKVVNGALVLAWKGPLGIDNEHTTFSQKQTYLENCKNESGVRFSNTHTVSVE